MWYKMGPICSNITIFFYIGMCEIYPVKHMKIYFYVVSFLWTIIPPENPTGVVG